jgi:hypothetical protein
MANRLTLRIYDHEPASAGGQLWNGGATDLTTRQLPPLGAWDMEQIDTGTLNAPENAGGVILVAMTPDPEREDEFSDWFNTEHIPFFNQLPGVVTARRFRAIAGSPKYVALH